jgi:hypothetical protein
MNIAVLVVVLIVIVILIVIIIRILVILVICVVVVVLLEILVKTLKRKKAREKEAIKVGGNYMPSTPSCKMLFLKSIAGPLEKTLSILATRPP